MVESQEFNNRWPDKIEEKARRMTLTVFMSVSPRNKSGEIRTGVQEVYFGDDPRK